MAQRLGVRPSCEELRRQQGWGSLLTVRQSWEAHGTAWRAGAGGEAGGPEQPAWETLSRLRHTLQMPLMQRSWPDWPW